MLSSTVLKASLETAFQAVFAACADDAGLSSGEYADRLAQSIADAVIDHIKSCAVVTTSVTGVAAGSYPVTGSGSGTIS